MDCILCGHPLQAEIDGILGSVGDIDVLADDKLVSRLVGQVNDCITQVYGDEAVLASARDVRIHVTRHPMFTTEGEIVVDEDTQVVRVGNKVMSMPSLKEACIILLALGMENIRFNPDLVKPHHTIDIMKLMIRLGMTLDEDELQEVLRKRIAEPTPVAQSDEAPFAPPDLG